MIYAGHAFIKQSIFVTVHFVKSVSARYYGLPRGSIAA